MSMMNGHALSVDKAKEALQESTDILHQKSIRTKARNLK
jgi:hypothetical protein